MLDMKLLSSRVTLSTNHAFQNKVYQSARLPPKLLSMSSHFSWNRLRILCTIFPTAERNMPPGVLITACDMLPLWVLNVGTPPK
ncbi:hypothetical protein AVEN_271996-1 [Araneus ventricosus]|uniref:Uncharacterized protein n=1 Tax=Araneus ventricosus TaxID=182803 RepID=A0A4Y2CBI7_ARAVE|nr:hypothetical protein AVEN_271996-1 [Araneus ventricosus]